MARRRRRSRFGALLHRGASFTRTGSGTRHMTIHVGVQRNIGASRNHQFCAWAYIPKSGHGRPKGYKGLRAGSLTCAPTPTVVIKRALRSLASSQWYRK